MALAESAAMAIPAGWALALLAAGLAASCTNLLTDGPGGPADAGEGDAGEGDPGGDDPFADQVVLLMHLTGANGSSTFADSTGRHRNASIVGTPVVSSTQSAFSGGSVHFDGNSYIYLPPSPDWDLTGSDATVEHLGHHTPAASTERS